jgi:RNA methyltransferase, TrmH family
LTLNPPEIITSRNNARIKQVRALRQRKQREASGSFLVEGIRPVGEAVAAAAAGRQDCAVEAIYYAPDLLTSQFARNLVEGRTDAGLPCYATSADVFMSIADKENPQGILAVAHWRQSRLVDLDPHTFPWGVALVAPQDPGNIGAILRTVDAVGASGLVLLEGGADPYHTQAVRASMGAIFWHPVAGASFAEFAEWVERHDYQVVGTSAHAETDFSMVPRLEKPLILLMGSEKEGLAEEHIALCHHRLRLPMHGRVTSLNLAVAAGVFLYAILEKFNERQFPETG